eukprot:6201810-Pleurochrysis_carterae.AAC.5
MRAQEAQQSPQTVWMRCLCTESRLEARLERRAGFRNEFACSQRIPFCMSLEFRGAQVRDVLEMLQEDMQLLCVTAVEDRLQARRRALSSSRHIVHACTSAFWRARCVALESMFAQK